MQINQETNKGRQYTRHVPVGFTNLIKRLNLRVLNSRHLMVGTLAKSNRIPDNSIWTNIIPVAIAVDYALENINYQGVKVVSGYRTVEANHHFRNYNGYAGVQHIAFRALHLEFRTAEQQNAFIRFFKAKCRNQWFITPVELPHIAVEVEIFKHDFRIPYTPFTMRERYRCWEFKYRGGIGIYKNYLHVDCRGHNQSWSPRERIVESEDDR